MAKQIQKINRQGAVLAARGGRVVFTTVLVAYLCLTAVISLAVLAQYDGLIVVRLGAEGGELLIDGKKSR